MPDYSNIPFGEHERWENQAMKKMSITGWKEKGLPPNTTMQEFTASRLTIPLFTSARVWICWNAWRSTTQPLKAKKRGNTASWRKRSAKAIPSILMCFMMQRRRIILPSKRKSDRKRASTYGRTNPFWTHRYPRRQTGETLMCIPLTQVRYWTTYYDRSGRRNTSRSFVFLASGRRFPLVYCVWGTCFPPREINTVSAVCGSSCTVFSRRTYKNHMDSKTLLCFEILITSSSRRLLK